METRNRESSIELDSLEHEICGKSDSDSSPQSVLANFREIIAEAMAKDDTHQDTPESENTDEDCAAMLRSIEDRLICWGLKSTASGLNTKSIGISEKRGSGLEMKRGITIGRRQLMESDDGSSSSGGENVYESWREMCDGFRNYLGTDEAQIELENCLPYLKFFDVQDKRLSIATASIGSCSTPKSIITPLMSSSLGSQSARSTSSLIHNFVDESPMLSPRDDSVDRLGSFIKSFRFSMDRNLNSIIELRNSNDAMYGKKLQGMESFKDSIRKIEQEEFCLALKPALKKSADPNQRNRTSTLGLLLGSTDRPRSRRFSGNKYTDFSESYNGSANSGGMGEKDWLATLRKEWNADTDTAHKQLKGNRRKFKRISSHMYQLKSTDRLQRVAVRIPAKPPSLAGAKEEKEIIINESQQTITVTRYHLANEPKPTPSEFFMAEEDNNNSNTWKSQLREAWNTELRTMDAKKQKWYLNRDSNAGQREERRKREKQLAKQAKQSAKQSEKERHAFLKLKRDTKKEIDKNKLNIQQAYTQCGVALRNLRLQEKQMKIDLTEETKAVQGTYNIPLIEMFLLAKQTNYIRLLAKITLQDYKSILFQAAISEMDEFMDQVDATSNEEDLPNYIPFTADDINDHCDIATLSQIYKGLKKNAKRLEKEVARLLLQVNADKHETRQASLNCLLMDTLSTIRSLKFHPWRDNQQLMFNSIVLNKNFPQGKKIEKLQSAVEQLKDDIPPNEIVDFIEDFCEEMKEVFSINMEEHGYKLRLFLSRAIYPRIFHVCFNHQKLLNEQNDIMFYRNRKRLLAISPKQLDPLLGEYYRDDEIIPFYSPIEVLENLIFHQCPTDMMMVIHNTMKCIHWLVQNHTDEEKELGADDLFPILLYVTIHAEIPSVHSHVHFMEQFAFEDERMTQLGYCVTMFSAAVSHVTNMSEAQIEEFLKKCNP